MSLLDEVGEELQEEGEQQQADMHPVGIGIGSDNHFIISQSVHILLDVECRLQQIELFVLIHNLFC